MSAAVIHPVIFELRWILVDRFEVQFSSHPPSFFEVLLTSVNRGPRVLIERSMLGDGLNPVQEYLRGRIL